MTKKLLLVLAMLFLACSVLSAETAGTPGNQTTGGTVGAHQRRFWDGDCIRPVRLGAGQGGGQRSGRHGAQSGRRQGHPASHVDRLGVYRNVGSVYPVDHFHEGRLGFFTGGEPASPPHLFPYL